MTRPPFPEMAVPDDDRIPRGWEYQRSPEPRRNRGCWWALLGLIAFWVGVALIVATVL